MSSHLLSPASPLAPFPADGFCGVVSVSEQGYECFEERDLVMIHWLRDQLAAWASLDDGRKPPAPGTACHHLKDQGKNLSPSKVSCSRLAARLAQHLSSAARLYEQGRLHSLESIGLYLSHWLRWSKGIGIATSNALAAIATTLRSMLETTPDAMIRTFLSMLMKTWLKTQTIHRTKTHEKVSKYEKVVSPRILLHAPGNELAKSGSGHCHV